MEKDSQKKMIGELLKAADRFIKSAEWNRALDEVGKALAIEPNNMYAMAYKDRINVSINEEKKKAEEEKVKRLAEEKRSGEKPAEEKKTEPAKPAEPPKAPAAEEKRPEPPKPEPAKTETKPAAPAKDDSSARLDALRQEFAATQAKLQREVAQLTMQLKEAQALKDATEKNLNGQIVALQGELNAARQNAVKVDTKETDQLRKEIDALKAKHLQDVETAREVAKADMLAQVALLQKQLEAAKANPGVEDASLKHQGELMLKGMFQKAWQDGTITNDERALLLVVKGAIEMTEAKFGALEADTRGDAYVNALRSVWSDGVVTPEESDFLTSLREKLGIPADEHFRLEGQIRKEVKK
ncbi:MAG: hypothetical protein HUU02_11870 [Bacteroidetes bacterium]|nr:hypothetical protein [Bacteroidota bacterium]